MHPYRTAPLESGPRIATEDGGLGLAFGVLTVLAAVQLAATIVRAAAPSGDDVFCATCFVVGLAWLAIPRGHGRDRARAARARVGVLRRAAAAGAALGGQAGGASGVGSRSR